jgi:hypothetical protein
VLKKISLSIACLSLFFIIGCAEKGYIKEVGGSYFFVENTNINKFGSFEIIKVSKHRNGAGWFLAIAEKSDSLKAGEEIVLAKFVVKTDILTDPSNTYLATKAKH